MGIIRIRKLLRITFFAIVREKIFTIQAISYIKIPAKIKSARKHSQMLPDSRNSRNFSSTDDSRYTVFAKEGDTAITLVFICRHLQYALLLKPQPSIISRASVL